MSVATTGLSHTLWPAVASLVITGGADLVSAVYRQTILQTYVRDEMCGRMQGVYTVVTGGPLLRDLRAGIMAETIGLALVWSGMAIIGLIIVLIAAVAVQRFPSVLVGECVSLAGP